MGERPVSNAPFRELFVELPRAVLDALKGIGEAAVKAAQPQSTIASSTYKILEAYRHDPIADAVCVRYGWRNYEVSRSAMHRTTEFGVRWPCKHSARIDIPDWIIEDGSGGILDALDRAESLGRPCFCMQRLP
jgi:hypothetical protein